MIKRVSVSTTLNLLVLGLLLTAVSKSQAQVALPKVVPVIQVSDFQVGRHWIWDYVQPSGQIYSTERYEVLSVNGSTVLIEMSSDYGGGQNFKAHTRIEVNVDQCIAAYRNRAAKTPWSFTMYSIVDGAWSPYDAPKTLAFEEKFNCNPHVQTDVWDDYLTAFSVIDNEPVFEQKLWRRIDLSWYSLSGPNTAVAFQKAFTADPSQPYTMKRRRNLKNGS